jgi:hypothetical protein
LCNADNNAPAALQNALEFLLSHAPKRLYAAFPQRWRNFNAASRAAYQLKKEHERIAAMYGGSAV